ncbi:uncharacterized protein LOC143295957 isoform X2 [Babylonia areolata]|uniref:uncharacterized protein LOC143295957 isoform X2 n=1 Tax=Babylonia areolata TaxID=304850 RepID=UPI003FD09A30
MLRTTLTLTYIAFVTMTTVTVTLTEARVLWQLGNMPSSSGHHPLDPFQPQSQAKFGEDSLSVVDDPAGHSGKVLRVFYQKGAQFYSRPTTTRTSMTLSYDLFFSDGFDFVKGGKLPGLFGGTTNCSGGRHSDLCFSTRLMWRSHGDGEVYAYLPSHQDPGLCHSSHNHCNPDYGNSLGRGTWRFKTGEWQTITQRLTLNTPGQLNGKVEVWLNGHHVLTVSKLNVRQHGDIQIEGIFFSTFFGGSDHTWAPTVDCYTYYKNFVLSTGDTEDIIG